MTLTSWVLVVATHVGSGAVVSMHDFSDKAACEQAAKVAHQVALDAGSTSDPHTWCVPKGDSRK